MAGNGSEVIQERNSKFLIYHKITNARTDISCLWGNFFILNTTSLRTRILIRKPIFRPIYQF